MRDVIRKKHKEGLNFVLREASSHQIGWFFLIFLNKLGSGGIFCVFLGYNNFQNKVNPCLENLKKNSADLVGRGFSSPFHSFFAFLGVPFQSSLQLFITQN